MTYYFANIFGNLEPFDPEIYNCMHGYSIENICIVRKNLLLTVLV